MYHGMTGIAAEQFARSQITPSTSCYRAYARVNTSAKCSWSLSLAIVSVKNVDVMPPSHQFPVPNENIIYLIVPVSYDVHRDSDNEIKRSRRGDGRLVFGIFSPLPMANVLLTAIKFSNTSGLAFIYC